MKKLLIILLCSPMIGFGQYSNYYNVNANIKKNVNVSGTINKNVNVSKTVTTVDYGALANANAQREANRLSRLQYNNQREKDQAIAIANDPSKAYDYGIDNYWKAERKFKKNHGWDRKIKYMYHKKPNSSLFVDLGNYVYENTSTDGVRTEIDIYGVTTVKKYLEYDPNFNPNIEEMLEYKELKVGELFNEGGSMLHKKDLKRATVGANKGFRGTLIWEDKYEKGITDNYASTSKINNKTYIFKVKVRYKGDVDEVSFEQLEGRRYYFRTLVEKIVATIRIY